MEKLPCYVYKKEKCNPVGMQSERKICSVTRVMSFIEGPKFGYESTSTLPNNEKLTLWKKTPTQKQKLRD